IQASGGLSDTDIEQMVKEAEEHADEDKKRRELVEARNHLETQVNATEKSLSDADDKLSDDVKEEVKAAIADAKTALDGEDVEALKAASAALAQTAMKIGEAVYGSGGDAGADEGPDGGDTGDSAGAQDDNVVDADFEEVNDDKKKSA
ncbi:MAG: Hsp70 family protein, partial [Pseudomonadota bacterium]